MATISVGDAVGEGFSLIRRKPGAVALWAVLVLGFLVVRIAAYLPLYGAVIAQWSHGGGAGGGAAPDFTSLLPQIQQAQALGILLGLASLFVNVVVVCAIYRAVLRPEQNRFGYLRVGSAELFLFVFIIAAIIVFVLGAVVAAIPIALIGVAIGHGSAANGTIYGVIVGIAAIAAVIYLALRLALVGPMMVDDGQFHLGDAWALTRGKVGSLFLIALLLVVIVLVAEIVAASTGFALMGVLTGGFSHWQTLGQTPLTLLSRLAPVLVVEGVAWIILISCALPVMSAPWARAYRDLKQADPAAAFG